MPERRTAAARRRTVAAGTVVGVAALVALAVTTTGTTGAAYQDQTFAQSEAIGVRTTPTLTVGLAKNSRQVDTGLGLGTDGNVYQWGRTNLNIAGSVQNPGTSMPPTKIPGMPEGGLCQVTGGIYDANALACDDGTVWGWGWFDSRNGTDADRPGQDPKQVRIGTAWNGTGPLLDSIVAISSSEYAGAGIRSDGTVWIWGGPESYGGNGDLRGASPLAGLPNPAEPGNRPVYLKGAYTNFFLILENGDVYSWGGTSSLPGGSTATDMTAQKVTALSPWFRSTVSDGAPYVVAVDGGINMGGAILSDGRVLSWGWPFRIGDRPTSVTPASEPGLVPNLEDIRDMQFGFTGVVFGTDTGDLWGYGAWDDYGQLPMKPVLVDTGVVAYASGQGYYLWQKADGTFWGRGYNPAGAIGTPVGDVTTNRQVSYDMTPLTQGATP